MGQSLYIGALAKLKLSPENSQGGITREGVLNGWAVRMYLNSSGKVEQYGHGMKDPDAVGMIMGKFPNDKINSHERHWIVLFGTHMYVVQEALLERANLTRRESPRDHKESKSS